MKFKEELVNRANVGDIVYGYDDLKQLEEIITSTSNENLKQTIVFAFKTEDKFAIYDMEIEEYFFVDYIYSVQETETRAERLLRLMETRKYLDDGFDSLKFLFGINRQICESFFKLKRNNIITQKANYGDPEDFMLDYTYDLEDGDDKQKYKDEIKDYSLDTIRYLFCHLRHDSRFVYHDEDLELQELIYNKYYMGVICEMIKDALNCETVF